MGRGRAKAAHLGDQILDFDRHAPPIYIKCQTSCFASTTRRTFIQSTIRNSVLNPIEIYGPPDIRAHAFKWFWFEVQPLHLLWQRGCIFLHYLHWFKMIFMIRHYYIDTRLMQIRPACPASTTSMSSTTSIRPRLLFLANFFDFSELGHFSAISASKIPGCHEYQNGRGQAVMRSVKI